MASLDVLLGKLWEQYSEITPQAKKVKSLFEKEGNTVFNDHIAFRTFNDPRVGIEKLSRFFIANGYEERGEYHFETKKLYAKHFEHENENYPKIFISELLLEKFDEKFINICTKLINQLDESIINSDEFSCSGRHWNLSLEDYNYLKDKSEYASWLSAWGYCANHFTVFVNKLSTLKSVAEVNEFLKSHGFKLNSSGGEIKGGSDVFLAQSSTMADAGMVSFLDGKIEIPSCYYEFAARFPLDGGKLYSGFVAKSADKIFESTNRG